MVAIAAQGGPHLGLALEPRGHFGRGGDERDQQRLVAERGRAPLAPVLLGHIGAPGQPVGRPEVDRLRAVEACARMQERGQRISISMLHATCSVMS